MQRCTGSFSVSYLGSLSSLWEDAAFIPSFIHLNLGRTEVRRNPRKTIYDRESSDHIHMWREGNEGKKAWGCTACNSSLVCLPVSKAHFGFSPRPYLKTTRLLSRVPDSVCCLEMDFLRPQRLLTQPSNHQANPSWKTLHTSLHRRQREVCRTREAWAEENQVFPGWA